MLQSLAESINVRHINLSESRLASYAASGETVTHTVFPLLYLLLLLLLLQACVELTVTAAVFDAADDSDGTFLFLLLLLLLLLPAVMDFPAVS